MAKLIIANWKTFLGEKESLTLARKILSWQKSFIKKEIVICPSFPVITAIKKKIGKVIKIGGQNVATEEAGALTGEVAAKMLADVGCDYVIIGHSERRRLFGETEAIIKKKLAIVLKNKIVPVLCVGETAVERKNKKTISVLKKQLEVLQDLSFKKIIIAYEPVWAVGSDHTPTDEEIAQAHLAIRTQFGKKSGLKIIYGGSVDENNISAILATPAVDGVLVGRASTKEDFWKKIKNLNC